MKKKKRSASNNTRVWLGVMMMVCERKAHSWSVSCPSSFFFFSSLLCCPLRPYTYTHTPSHHQLRALIRIFSTRIRARASASCRARSKTRLFFSFLSPFAMRPYDRTRRRTSLLLLFFRVRIKRKTNMVCLHNYI
jgi:hypothetical protein